MAQKRMLDKKISISEQIADLDIKGKLLFTWMIPHADDLGLLPYSSRTIKALVVPIVDEINVEDIGIQLESMRKKGLIMEFVYLNQKYWKINGFLQNQTLKKDRQPMTILPLKLNDDFKKNWQLCEKMILIDPVGFHLETIGNQIVPEVKISKDKISNINTNPEKTFAPTSGASPLQGLLEKKRQLIEENKSKAGATLSWQDAADRMRKSLNITLPTELVSSWYKIFKDASADPVKNGKIQTAYGWLQDNETFRAADDDGRTLLFFETYHHGIPRLIG